MELILSGKGRVPADDRGDIGMHPAAWHSLLSSAAAPAGATLRVEAFSTSPAFDFVAGRKSAWRRQIAFSKDADPFGPNWFVVADTFDAKPVPTIWRLFLRGRIVPRASGVTLEGTEDVDLDVIFVRPAGAQPTIHADHIQLAVAAAGTVTAVLYPRSKTEPSPKVAPLAGGRGVTVTTAHGTDTVFLDPETVTHQAGGLSFEGKAGLVRDRNGKRTEAKVGPCDVTPGWEGGDRELRTLRREGPQHPVFPDE
jgi:hypothetical protein